jgi:hypothetical protein
MRTLVLKRCERLVDLLAGAGANDLNLQAPALSGRLQVSKRGFRRCDTRWIDERSHPNRVGDNLMQHFEPLRRQLGIQNIDPCQIATWPGQAADQSKPDRVLGHDKNHGDCHGGLFGRNRRKIRPECSEDSDPTTDQIIGQCGQPIKLVLCPAIFDHYVLALDIADLFESLAEYGQTIRRRFRRCRVEDPDYRHCRPLRPRRERPSNRRAADERDELAPRDAKCHLIPPAGRVTEG